tara:strand:- start:2 stop:325 length:324 start_codon:yes stop_codon:yes gene_type:complete
MGEGGVSRTRKKAKTGGKAVDHSCRNNGTCDYCKGNRLHKHKRKELVMDDEKEGKVEFDIPEDEEYRVSLMSMGIRLAILQGIYDVTYTEIAECLEENFSHRKVNTD